MEKDQEEDKNDTDTAGRRVKVISTIDQLDKRFNTKYDEVTELVNKKFPYQAYTNEDYCVLRFYTADQDTIWMVVLVKREDIPKVIEKLERFNEWAELGSYWNYRDVLATLADVNLGVDILSFRDKEITFPDYSDKHIIGVVERKNKIIVPLYPIDAKEDKKKKPRKKAKKK